MEFQESNESEREQYMNKIKQEAQRRVINGQASSATSVCSVTWTHRTTGCDVISTVTTTLPIKNGNMRDIKMYNMEMRKIKAPGKKPGLNLYVNPLEDDATGGNIRSRKHFNDILRAERAAFMSRLHKSRHLRSTTENISAVIIQRIFRGYWVRWHIDQIVRHVQSQGKMRQRLRTLAASKGIVFPLLSEHRAHHSRLRNGAAIIIQCAFRCYICRVLIRRRRREMFHRRRQSAAVLIQCMVRIKSACDRVGVLRERRILYKRFRAAVMLQSVYRGILGKRRVRKRMLKLRWIAARMIQCAFRGRHTRRSFALYMAAAERIKLYRGARGVQKIVRACIAKARVRRIRLRKLYRAVFGAATRIQTLMRLVLCNKRMLVLMVQRQEKRKADEEAAREKQEKDEEAQAQELADSIDIFVQTKLGNTVNVDSLYHHEVESGADATSCTNEEGDSILSVAARYGHLDIVRKCLQWGFDVNHENASGESVVALAAENEHLEVLLYLLSTPSVSSKSAGDADDTFLTSSTPIQFGIHDTGIVLTAAAKAADVKYLRAVLDMDDSQLNSPHPVTEATALHVACESGNLEMVQLLIKNGAAVDCVDDMGHTPLQKACSSDNVDVVKLLLGMSADYANEAFPSSDAERSELLLQKDSDGKDTLLMAAIRGRSATLQFITKTADLSTRTISDEIGWSTDDIESAVQLAGSDNVMCLQVLAEANFDLSWAPEGTGTNMAMVACRHGQLKVLDFLLQKKVDFSVKDEQGRNALHYAAECTTENVIPFLLSSGAERTSDANLSPALLSQQDVSGSTVLHVVAQHNSTLSFELVALDHMSIALSTPDNSGRTPLHIACVHGFAKMIHEMVRLEANVKAVDKNGKNALWHYIYPLTDKPIIGLHPQFDQDVVKALLKAGCPLFCAPYRAVESSAAHYRNYCSNPQASDRKDVTLSLEAADLLAAASKLSLLTALANTLDAEDEWRLALSCIFFGTTNKPLASVLDEKGVPTLMSWDPEVTGRAGIVGLEGLFFLDLTIMGWAIKAENVPVITYLLRMGFHPARHVDRNSNNALHYAVMLGNLKVVDTVLNAHDEVLPLEAVNDCGHTAAMIAARAGNMIITRKLLRCGCSARQALAGKYWGWLLALVRQKEQYEMDTQTGIYGNDDKKYFPLHPDPTYVMWG